MAINIKTDKEIKIMERSGKILGDVLRKLTEVAEVGMSTWDLDQIAEKMIRERGGEPGFKGFHGFPGTLCTTINDEIVHGIPRKDQIIEDGDLLTVDCGVRLEGFNTDAARTVQVGKKTDEGTRLIKTAETALARAIKAAQPGTRLDKVSQVIQETIEEAGYCVIYDLTGHGIGRTLHEDPVVFNYLEKSSKNPVLKPGMTICIEPIFSESSHEMVTLEDDWTIVTSDKSLSVQVEQTVLITQNGNKILTA